MDRATLKKIGRRKAGSYGPPRKGNKRVANKAVRKLPIEDRQRYIDTITGKDGKSMMQLIAGLKRSQ